MKIKRNINVLALALTVGIAISCTPSVDDGTKEGLFPKGKKLNSENFTGTVWLQMMRSERDTTLNIAMGNVTFEPGARTNWHYHPGGQVLMITNGKGLYQEEAQPIEVIIAGDVVKCPPNTPHWHGATPEDTMVHMAISLNTDKGGAVWQEAVTDKEYTNMEKR